MLELQRFTTEYSELEDRIRLAGEVASNPPNIRQSPQVLWLTRRLLELLVPHLTLWLERQTGDLPRADVLLNFAQHAAMQQMTPQPPVAPGPATAAWLVREVDIQPGQDSIYLTFKSAPQQRASIRFAANALRQWLAILQHAYNHAHWPGDVWPSWMSEQVTTPVPTSRLWH